MTQLLEPTRLRGMAIRNIFLFSALVFGTQLKADEPQKLNVTCHVIEVAGRALPKESWPASDVTVGSENIDRNKAAALKALTEKFNANGDPLVSQIFSPLHGARKFEIQIVLTSGFPHPYDAWTAQYKSRHTIFLNTTVWDREKLLRAGFGIIKHEIAHVLLAPLLKTPKHDDAIERLDHIVVNEGIAHYIGYSKDRSALITENRQKWIEAEATLAKSMDELRDGTLSESRRQEILKTANTGPFWKKYAAISGMFRAAKRYEKSGAQGLIEAVRSSKLD